MWELSFITEEAFTKHVRDTIRQYGKSLEPIDMERFNRNIIDPVKLIFDKTVYQSTWEAVIGNEIARQRDKSNNNAIGYFHQNIFDYIEHCHVPKNGEEGGWDVIYHSPYAIDLEGKQVHTIYVEMKNKHNTTNSSSDSAIFSKMEDWIHEDEDCACFRVEVISKKSQNKPWKRKKKSYKRIRRVSIDRFYELVTGEPDAFYQVCKVLPGVIREVVGQSQRDIVPKDTVLALLKQRAGTKDLEADNAAVEKALYRLAFGDYLGFHNFPLF